MLTPFEHSNHVAKHNIPEKLELWTAATSGQTITPRVDFPAQYAGRVYWQISDGALKPATSGAEINHTFTANGSHRVRLIGVPINQITYLSASSDYISQDISAFPIHKYRSLATLFLSSTSVSGDISGWTLPNSLRYLYLHSTSVSGDISGWTLPNSMTTLFLSSTSVSGDISGWTLPNSLGYLSLHSTSVSGDISGWTLPASLVRLYLHSTSVSGDISGWTLPASLASLYLSSTSVSGDISGWTLPNSLGYLSLHSTSVSGDISGWTLPNSMTTLFLYSTSVTVASTFAGVGTGMRDFRIQDCGLSAAHVGNVVESIWNARAGFTYATPVLNVGGMNAAPAGNVIAPIEGADWHDDSGTWIPLTAGAMIWDLAKDVNSEGFKKWTVTYNGGVASP